MIAVVSNDKLGFSFGFNQDSEKVIDELRSLYIEKYGPESYAQASVIIVSEGKFFHTIKNIYNLPSLYEFSEDLQFYIEKYLIWERNIFKESTAK